MLTHCPCCKYDLTGLPDRHRCPECGYDYDRHSDMVELVHPFKRALPFIYTALTIWGAFLIWRSGFTHSFVMGVVYPALITLPWVCQRRRVTVMTPTELQFIAGRKIASRCSLENVASAYWSPIAGHVVLHDAEGLELRSLPDTPRWSSTDTKRITAAINNRLKLRTGPFGASAVAERTDDAVNPLAETSERS